MRKRAPRRPGALRFLSRPPRRSTTRCAIDALNGGDAVVLVDCLTLWVSNLLLADADIPRAGEQLCDAIARFDGTLIFVANEVGLGIVPDNTLARRFRDAAGLLNQSVAATVEEVVLLTAGLPLTLKQRG